MVDRKAHLLVVHLVECLDVYLVALLVAESGERKVGSWVVAKVVTREQKKVGARDGYWESRLAVLKAVEWEIWKVECWAAWLECKTELSSAVAKAATREETMVAAMDGYSELN